MRRGLCFTLFSLLLFTCFCQEVLQGDMLFVNGDTLMINHESKPKVDKNNRTENENFLFLPTGINGINSGTAQWVDYDSDGFLDIVINGFKIGSDDISHATIFRNQGNNSFSRVEVTSFTRTIYGGQDWGDYNNDGNMDLIQIGTTSGFNDKNITEIHKNLGNNTFTMLDIDLPRMSRADVHWEDLDSDGDLDIFLMGLDSNLEFLARIYVNVGNDRFERGPDILTGGSGRINFNRNKAIWADFDNDGDLDGVLGYASRTGGFGIKLIENLGDLNFSEKDNALPQMNYATIDVFDFNNDNRLDFAIAGNFVSRSVNNTNTAFLYVMENQGELNFTEFYSGRTGSYWGSIDCGDFNNDGFSDILINGYGNNARSTFVLVNNNATSFERQDLGFTQTGFGGAHWGKLAQGGSLDVLIHGSTSSSSSDAISHLFMNPTILQNLPPTSPPNVTYAIDSNSLLVNWESATDDLTGTDGMTYNVRLGTRQDQFDIIQGSSNLSGARKVMKIGNNGTNKHFQINDLPKGTYFFGVQAIDNSFNASAFTSIEICFGEAINLPDTLFKCQEEPLPLNLSDAFVSSEWNTGATTNSVTLEDDGWYTVEAVDIFGCRSKDSVLVKNFQTPAVDLGSNEATCYPPNKILNANFPDSEFLWSDGSKEAELAVDSFGLYWVEVSNFCGIDRDTIEFSYTQDPELAPVIDLGEDQQLCNSPNLTLAAFFPDSEFLWSNGSNEAELTIDDYGTYWVQVSNECGVTSDTIRIEKPGEVTFIPNVFTPNDDGINEYFEVAHDGAIQLLVFNRSGYVVYKSADYDSDWNADGLASGQYYYQLIDECGRTNKGSLSILR